MISVLNPSNDRIFALINIKTRFNKTNTVLKIGRELKKHYIAYSMILYFTIYTALYYSANVASI